MVALTVRFQLMSSGYLPARVVCLQPSATVILAALGQLHRVVACTKYCADVVPEVRDGSRLIVADSWTAQSEQIATARPDLVVAAVPYQEKAVGEILKAGARFLGLAPKSLADIYGDITSIAGLMGVPERGRDLIVSMQGEIETVRRRAENSTPPRVYCEEWGNPLIRSQRWVAELVEAAGGEFLGVPGSRTTAAEVLAEAPEVIITAWCGAGDRVPLAKIIRDRHWDELPAVRAGRVFCIRDELLNTPAPTLVRGLHALAAALHPGKFPHPDGLRCLTGDWQGSASSAHP